MPKGAKDFKKLSNCIPGIGYMQPIVVTLGAFMAKMPVFRLGQRVYQLH